MRRRPFLAFLLVLVCAGAAWSAPSRPRPYSGCGVVSLEAQPGSERGSVVLYQDPGVARLGEVDPETLPRLSGSPSEPLLAVTARKGGWLRLSYDDAGREGWLEQERSWRYLSWEDFLPGRRVRVLAGLRKGEYAVRSKPGPAAVEMASLSRDQSVRVLRVEQEWALLEAPLGWFRWRDADGRLTVSP